MKNTDVDENGVIPDGYFAGSHTKPGSVRGLNEREMVWHRPVPPEVSEDSEESHPAYAMVSVHKVTTAPGAVLFDSDIRHQHFMQLVVQRATRKRDLNHDWIHPDRRPLIEIDMSMAQWASFVSSSNTSGVPATLRKTETQGNLNGLEFEPRLKESMAEIKGAAQKVFGRIDEAMAEWDALDPKAGVKERRAVQAKIRNAVAVADSNMVFAAQSLEKHAENVVQKARADIEAMVYTHAQRLGLDPAQTLNDLALETGNHQPKEIEQ